MLLRVWKWRSAVLIICVQSQFTSFYPEVESRIVQWTDTRYFKISSVERIPSNSLEAISFERLCLVIGRQMVLALARRNIVFAQ